MEDEKVLQIDTTQAQKNIQQLEDELKNVNNQLKQAEIGSDAFNQLQKKAASLKGELDDLNNKTQRMSKGIVGYAENIGKIGAGISGSFGAALGALRLFGVESESVTKSIEQLQSVMAITQGLSQMKDAVEGFKKLGASINIATGSMTGFKAALVSTGIGALVVAVGMLAANWDKVSKALGFATKSQKEYNKELIETNRLKEEQLDKYIERELRLLKAQGATQEELYTKEIEGIKRRQEANKQEQKQYIERINLGKKLTEDEQKRFDELRTKWNEYQEELVIIQAEQTNYHKKQQDEQTKKEKDELDKRLQQQRDYLIELADLERQRKEILEGTLTPTENKSPYEQSSATGFFEGEDEDEGYFKLAEQYFNYLDAKKEADLTYLESLEANKQSEINFITQLEKKGIIDHQKALDLQSKADKEYTKKSAEYQIQAATTVASGVASILDSIASMQDENDKEGFERSKNLQVASTTINMLAGITAALSGLFTTKSGPWDIALATIQAATIAASGIANIAKIRSTKFDDNGSTSASASTPSASAISASVIQPTQYTQAVQGAQIEDKIGDTKVYVTETDISNTMKKVLVQETENRY